MLTDVFVANSEDACLVSHEANRGGRWPHFEAKGLDITMSPVTLGKVHGQWRVSAFKLY
jgi:hypothetical protein